MGLEGKATSDGEGSSLGGKRKHINSNKTGGGDRKRIMKGKNLQGVLDDEFIKDDAFEVDENESNDFIDADTAEDEFGSDVQIKNEPGNVPLLPFFPEQEGIDEEEFDKMLENYYKAGSSLVTYTENGGEAEPSIEENRVMPSAEDPIIWKVKCVVGREKHSAFCLMQKYVDLKSLGTELQIISVFALERRRGFIFIEAYKQCHINEACKGLCNINLIKVSPVPKNELSHLLYVRSKCSVISAGTWTRVKNGKYKGDLAQVVALNKSRKKATVKLVPRIDLQALAEKIGRGVTSKKTAIPKPRLVTSRELEEFRPLIQYKRDHNVGVVFEVLDGMMLKDGYLYKKVPVDSLIFWGVTLSEDEKLWFEPSVNDESKDLEWLSLLYGEKKANCTTMNDNEGEQGEGPSCSIMVNSCEVHDLVFFGRKDFGVIIGTEMDDSFKILKEGSEGPVIVTLKQDELKKASFNKKLSALDRHSKILSIDDIVRVLEGPLKDRQGVVKQIYRGTIFLYDENEQENNGYFCSKAQTCEIIKLSVDGCDTKLAAESEAPGTEKILPSPKSSLLSKKRSDNNCNFNRGNKDGMFYVGQSLRIRVGPLKGYLCRVMAFQDSNVTVKLDSQHKILRVKGEDLFDGCGRNSAISKRSVPRSVKSFSLLGTQNSTKDRMDGVGTSTEGEKRVTARLSTQRSSHPSFPASSFSLKPESGFTNRLNSLGHGLKKGNNVIGNPSSWRGSVHAGNNSMDSWKKPSAGSWNKQLNGGRSSWSKQANANMKDEAKCRIGQNNISERQKSFGWDREFGGWNKCTMVEKDNIGQQSFGQRPITFESGRGGRGGRGLFGARRSLGRSQPSVLTKRSQQNYGTSEGTSSRNLSSWNGGQVAVNNWNKRVAVGSDGGPTWRKQGGKSIWDKQAGFNAEGQSESFGRGRGYGGRNNGNTEKIRSLERPKPSERGRGGGLIRGRGGGRGRGIGNFGRGSFGRGNFGGRGGTFGRGNFGRGGSFDQGQPLTNWTNDFMASPMGNVKNWNRGGQGWGNAKVCGRGKMMT